MAKNLTNTIECLDALEKEAAKLRRDNPGDEGTQKFIDGLRHGSRKLKLALRADGLVDSVQTLTTTPAAKRAPVKATAPAKKAPAKAAAPTKKAPPRRSKAA